MKCEYCDNPVPNGATRCPSCGAAMFSDFAEKSSIQSAPAAVMVSSADNHMHQGSGNEQVIQLIGRKSRICYVLLGLFLGELGVHNFYAGFIGRGVAQLLITILSFGFLFWLSWIWALIEIIVVSRDAKGVGFK